MMSTSAQNGDLVKALYDAIRRGLKDKVRILQGYLFM